MKLICPRSTLRICGSSSNACKPCHSVRGSEPSTGRVQSKLGSRFGIETAVKAGQMVGHLIAEAANLLLELGQRLFQVTRQGLGDLLG